MKHKHHDKIVAKAANTGLVQFIKMDGEWDSAGLSDKFISFSEEYDYFLCLPQHKEAVLHSLNGGEAVSDSGDGDWCLSSTELWCKDWWYMCESYESKIKPKKEKRWICITDNLEIEDGTLYESLEDANENSPGYKQIIEIEVEVKL